MVTRHIRVRRSLRRRGSRACRVRCGGARAPACSACSLSDRGRLDAPFGLLSPVPASRTPGVRWRLAVAIGVVSSSAQKWRDGLSAVAIGRRRL